MGIRRAMFVLLYLTISGAVYGADQVPYPEGYRSWYHVKSMVIRPGHDLYDAFGGIHHIYANSEALQGYRSGRFPGGAVIVFDLLAVERSEHAIAEGRRKVLGVMHRDPDAYAATDGWGYEAFKGGDAADRAVQDNATDACHGCHSQKAEQGYVFSRLRP